MPTSSPRPLRAVPSAPRGVGGPRPGESGLIDPRRVALLCNPRAGGRWKVLAEVLDSPEAQLVRRIVTDDIDDVRTALAELGRRTDLLCIYGGDGTVFRVLNELAANGREPLPRIALLGGGTMNVTSRACGMRRSPAENFREVIRAYRADRATWREIPLLAVDDGEARHFGFTFGVGPVIRILADYESGKKGVPRALQTVARSAVAAVAGHDPAGTLREMTAEITADGEVLPYGHYSAVFCNTTGTINPYVRPFVGERSRDSLHFLAYAGSSRSFALLLPFLARGRLPVDPEFFRKPISTFRRGLLSAIGEGELPSDPRYVNHAARGVSVKTDEKHYTIDGEILPLTSGAVSVKLGPVLRMAVLEPRRIRRLA